MLIRNLADSDARLSLESLAVPDVVEAAEISVLIRFEKLQTLTFDGKITDLNSLQNLRELVKLDSSCIVQTPIRSDTLVNLTELDMCAAINDPFIQCLEKMRCLQILWLRSQECSATEQGWVRLQNVTGLITFSLDTREKVMMTNFVLHLGSVRTLKTLRLYNMPIDAQTIVGIGRFTELHELYFRPSESESLFEPLQQLTKLEEIAISSETNDLFVPDFLQHVGSVDTLQRIVLPSANSLGSLQRFKQLQSVTIDSSNGLTDDVLSELGNSLPHLRSLLIWNELTEFCSWNGMLSLIRGAAELQRLQFKFSDQSISHCPHHVLEAIAEIGFRRDKVLTIQYGLTGLSPTDDFKYSEYIRFQ